MYTLYDVNTLMPKHDEFECLNVKKCKCLIHVVMLRLVLQLKRRNSDIMTNITL